ncbi:MAG: STAS domain-containing protein [Parvularculaceae bacterium]
MVILLTTLSLTIFRDLTEAIIAGVALGSLLFIHRMSAATLISAAPLAPEDRADSDAPRAPFDSAIAQDPDIAIYRITGAFFFAAAASAGAVLDNVAQGKKALIVDFSAVPMTDSTGARTIEGLAHKLTKKGVPVYVAGASADVAKTLAANGARAPLVAFAPTASAAAKDARARIGKPADPAPAA